MFLSDLHLGSRGCRSGDLIDFLSHNDADTIYLVGDVLDAWRLSSQWYWPPAHDRVLRALTGAARAGRRVVYLPGNHDDFLRGYGGAHFAGVEVLDRTIHVAADGRRYLVIHGDVCDPLVASTRRIHRVGYRAERTVLALDSGFNLLRRRLGLPRRSMTQWAKHKLKTSLRYISEYERAIADLARSHAVDGVICGHVHHAAMHGELGVAYLNCGDWVESCTAIVEDDGRFEIIRWRAAHEARAVAPAQARAA